MKVNKNKLGILMAEKCLTVDELAKLSNLSKPTVLKLKNKHWNAKPQTIGKLAKALEVSVVELVGKE